MSWERQKSKDIVNAILDDLANTPGIFERLVNIVRSEIEVPHVCEDSELRDAALALVLKTALWHPITLESVGTVRYVKDELERLARVLGYDLRTGAGKEKLFMDRVDASGGFA